MKDLNFFLLDNHLIILLDWDPFINVHCIHGLQVQSEATLLLRLKNPPLNRKLARRE